MANTIGTAYIQIEPTTKGIGGSISSALSGEAESAGSKAGGILSKALGTAATVGVTAIAGATAAVGAFGKASVDAGQQFDSSMSQVAATMGYSTAELADSTSEASKSFQQLRDFAQEMGSTTAFSASEAADALNYMALAGYDADTSMQMLPNVLNLAAAGGIDLASASDMVTDAQSALGLSLEETSIMVDQMATASSKSNTSVAQLGEAFLTIGANAKSLSGGTQELSTALGILADNGIKGAEGGTHLRNIMLALNPTTDKAVDAWNSLGVSAYDAQGNLRPLEDTFADLNQAMAGMSDQEKSEALTKMFNKTDLASINALLSTTSERWTELGSAIESSTGAAQNMADVQLDNLSGDITLFQSALEGTKIAISDALTPALRDFVQIGSEGLSSITEGFKTGGIEGAMTAVGETLNNLVSQITSMLPQMLEAGMSLLKALGEGIIENLPTLIETGLQIILELANSIAESLPELIPTIVDVMVSIVETLLDNVDNLIEGGIAIILGLANGLVEAIPRLIEKIPEIITKIIQALVNSVPQLVKGAVQLVVSLVTHIPEIIASLIKAIPEIIVAILEGFVDLVTGLIDLGKEAWEGLTEVFSVAGEWFGETFSKAKEKASEAWSTISDFMGDTWETIKGKYKDSWEFFKDNFSKAKEGVITAWDNITDFFGGIWDKIKNVFSKAWEAFKDIGGNLIKGLKEGISNAWNQFSSWVTDKFKSVIDAAKNVFGIHSPSKVFADEVGKMIPAGIAVGIDANTDSVTDSIDSLSSEAIVSANKLTSDINYAQNYSASAYNNTDSLVEQIGARIETALQSVGVYMDGQSVGRLVAYSVDSQLGKISTRRV